MKSWRTSVGSIISAIGIGLTSDPKLAHWGQVANALGIVLLGLSARDNKVTSEQAGASKPAENDIKQP